ncbi:unnamed protein product [Paramecium sonneborni]|uniref:Transmembrane protein n=1 Tax=Paramecium sonneborni TaxID=65129 RepID=A0A8S1LFL3_9CILI|nr:unnamed protein product [Paramecium sonneborni]
MIFRFLQFVISLFLITYLENVEIKGIIIQKIRGNDIVLTFYFFLFNIILLISLLNKFILIILLKYQILHLFVKILIQQVSNTKKEILNYIDPYIYGQYHNYHNQPQEQQYYLQQTNQSTAILYQNQLPVYSQNPLPIIIQPSQYMQQYNNPNFSQSMTEIPQQYYNSQFSKIGQQSMQKIDNLLTGI